MSEDPDHHRRRGSLNLGGGGVILFWALSLTYVCVEGLFFFFLTERKKD